MSLFLLVIRTDRFARVSFTFERALRFPGGGDVELHGFPVDTEF